MRNLISALVGAALLVGAGASHAGVIIDTLGNAAPGFNDGDFIGAVQLGSAQTGSPAPFDAGNASNGLEVNGIGSNFAQSWTHSYAAIATTITSASLSFGIYDSEGGSVGVSEADPTREVTLADQQLGSFTVEAADYNAALIAAGFEDGGQGLNGQYEVYTVGLDATQFTDLADGSADFSLSLVGPVFSPALLVFLDDIVVDFNAAALVFSTLTINFEDPTQPPGVPEPATLALTGLGMLGALVARRRRRTVPSCDAA